MSQEEGNLDRWRHWRARWAGVGVPLASDIYTGFLHTLKTLRDINFRDKISARTLNDRLFLPLCPMRILTPMASRQEGPK